MDIQTILAQIDLGSYALPEFQRGYVWNREQVRKLMNSLYKGYPIGGLLVWVTQTNEEITRGDGELTPGAVNLILDGQQRITSLHGIIKGKPPKFFEGNEAAFTGLYFNLQDESFEFYAPLKMKDSPNWVNVTELMQLGVGNYIQKAMKKDTDKYGFLLQQFDKLNRIDNIKKVNLHIQQVAGEDKTIDVVVEIFNNVNSGGTKLSKGDLALAKICAQWPEARKEMRDILGRLASAGYSFELEWLLRCVTVYLTGKPYFSELSNINIQDFKEGLKASEKLIDLILNQIGSRLGLDHDRVLGSRYSIPLMVGYLKREGGKLRSAHEWNKLLYWYVHTFLWGRYAGSTESVLAQDLNIIEKGEGIDGLVRQLRQVRGDLTIRPEDFWGWSTGARFYPLLYMLTRTGQARDWGNGLELKNALLGKLSSLEVHHIFPKDILYKNNYSKAIVNALANYSFLTKETNLEISNQPPREYLPKYIKRHPGAVESHWIPLEPEYWEIDAYEKFLEKRRNLLAAAANQVLDSLLQPPKADIVVENYANRDSAVSIEISPEEEERLLFEVSLWMEEHGLFVGYENYELVDENGKGIAMADIAWPDGIQKELSESVAILINESDETKRRFNQKGYRYFTDTEEFKVYVESNYL